MSNIEVCQKLFLIGENVHEAAWVVLFHNEYSGHRNRYCYWEINANRQEKENAVVTSLKLNNGKRIKKMVDAIEQLIAAKSYLLIPTYNVLMNSTSDFNLHIHYYANKLLLLANFDLQGDALYFKSPIVPIKGINETIFKKLKGDYKFLDRFFYHSFPIEYNKVVEDILKRWPKK